jgi:anti-sigma factor RsiW
LKELERVIMNCRDCQSALPDLFFDPAALENDATREHIRSCAACHEEFASLGAAFALLDTWTAPEPSVYFDQKLAVRLREEQAMAPAGWLERMRNRLLFNTGRQFRPALAGALALVLLIGGGTVANFGNFSHPGKTEVSATVEDLQLLDRNDQALQTMDQLLQEDSSTDDGSQKAAPTI